MTGQTATERIESLKAENAALRERLAAVAAVAEQLWQEGERASRRRAYASGVAFRGSAGAIREALQRTALDPGAGGS